MIFKLHYLLLTAGGNAFSILLGVFIEAYTDASPSEIGALLMVTPFVAMFGRPILCSKADREQAHRKYLIICIMVKIFSYLPFVVIPFMGEQLYRQNARACWYLMAALKVCGDLAVGGICSIGDSLAINHANRVGDNFGTYRVWGTVSWMAFGIIIGQFNEVWFLPKYVPAFIILIISLGLDAILMWLWPDEYFVMTDTKMQTEARVPQQPEKEVAPQKHLMSAGAIWAQAKAKLCRVFLCQSSADSIRADQQQGSNPETIEASKRAEPKKTTISKMVQLKILTILVRRDLRIVMYIIFFALAGACHATLSFFFIYLSRICHQQNNCDFSQLAGFLQFSMAILETFIFIYVDKITKKIGRLNLASLAMLAATAKFLFYGTIWTQVSPYYSLLSEGLTGIIYGINLTLMVEVGHVFANEVRYIVPELLHRDIISAESIEIETLNHSLAATMQALISSAFDGVGMGFGSLIYGVLLERISYESLWLIIGLTCSISLLILITAGAIEKAFGLKLGLDVEANDERKKQNLANTVTISQIDTGDTDKRKNTIQSA